VIDLACRGKTDSQALANLDKAVSQCAWHGHRMESLKMPFLYRDERVSG
jgi:hypothetical protein